MTVVFAGVGLCLTLFVTAVSSHLAHAVVTRTRAQAAADAAALAAVAEAAPYGGGSPEKAADVYARRNGGRVVDCRCARGATAVQVEVEVDGVTAAARAVIDPALLGPAVATTTGLHPRLRAAVDALVAVSQGAVRVGSGYRSTQEQTRLWTKALRRYGSAEAADDWVAPPGHSMHEMGLAVDLSGDIALAVELVERLGLPLRRPMAHEPWHFELVGSRS